MRFKAVLLSTIAASVGFYVHNVAAQEAGAGEPPKNSEISEIIVTARKRPESDLKSPVVETVLSPELLQDYQVANLSDIATKVTGLLLGEQVLTSGTQVSIRGVGTSALDPGVDQSVTLNLDGLPLSQGLAFKSAMFDLAQVEVLKGPQALFYGKADTAGVIAVQTADPGDKFEVRATTGYEQVAQESRSELIVSGPVTDTLGLRLAGQYSDYGGYFFNDAEPVAGFGGVDPKYHRFGGTQSGILRGTALWKPSSNFTAKLKLNYTQDDENGGADFMLVSCPQGNGPVPGFGIPFLQGAPCHLGRNLAIADLDPAAFPGVSNNGVPFMNITQAFGMLELDYTPRPDLTITSVSGYYHVGTRGLISGTQAAGTGPTISSDNSYRRHDFTEELRATSDFSGPLNFTVGAFHEDGHFANNSILHGNDDLALGFFQVDQDVAVDIKSDSLFGQARWKIVPQLELSAGARWSDERRYASAINYLTDTSVPIATPRLASDNWSPEVTLTYTPTDTLTLFGSLKQGYKSGSFSSAEVLTFGPYPAKIAFGDEEVQGGELGLKTRLLDHTLSVDFAVYNYNYRGLQVGVNSPASNGVPVNMVENAGAANVYGVDLDLAYRPPSITNLALRGAVNWNHARFTDLHGIPCYGGQTIAEGCNELQDTTTGLFTSQNLTGSPLVRAPDMQVTLGADYQIPLSNGMTLQLGADSQYSSRYLANLGLRQDFYQGSYAKINTNVTLKSPGDHWEFSFIGNNLTDRLTYGNCTNFNGANGQLLGGQITGGTARGPAGIDELGCYPDRGRELWLRITAKL